MSTIRIALAQINSTVGDLEGNVAKIIAAMERARDAEADIVTFPELAVCGYPPEDLLLKPGFLRDSRNSIDEIARQNEGIISLVGFAYAVNGNVYNAAALINNMHIANIYHKIELPNYGVFDEKRYFTPGSGCLPLEMNETTITVNICEDIWIEGSEVEYCTINNRAGVALNISASPFHAGKLALRRDIIASFAKRTKAFVCYNNMVGGQDELVFDGGSVVVDPQGDVVASARRFEEDLLVTDIPIDEDSQDHAGSDLLRSRQRIILSSSRYGDREGIPASRAPELGRLEEIHQALILGTRDYVRKNGFEEVVIGLSGGIDSSLTAAIAVDALGNDNVIGVTMPSQYTSQETRSDAERVAENMGIRLITVPVKPIFSSYLDALQKPFGQGDPGVENENLQARIRGNILMALSNRFGWLVLTTGNKSETAVGYCTLYGDMAGGFAVIKDVPKTLVYELAQYVNEKSAREAIPRSVLERPPTAELKPDQKDEDSLPSYYILDPILEAYVEKDKSSDEIIASGFDAEVIREVIRMVDRSEYKRRQAPPGVKITPKAFGKDRRLPITNRYFARTKSD
jgi:NAD+ synthase (glutamine-hydrolysing)